MKVALIGEGYWGSKIANECNQIGIEFDTYEIGSDLSNISPKEYIGAIIATPAEDHVNSAIVLLKNNNNILIEKPISMNIKEFKKLKSYVSTQKIMVGHILIYNELYQQSKKHIEKLKHIHTRRNAWGRLKKNITPILNLAPHDVALLDDIFQKYPTSVHSHGVYISGESQPDTVFCFLEYDDIQVTLELGWYNHDKIRETNFVCADKHIIWNDVKKCVSIKELFLNEQKKQQQNKKYNLQISEQCSPLQNQIEAFKKYCVENIEPITNLQHAERVTTVVDKLEESLQKQKKICL